jgi:hypothetical protein
MSFSNPVLSDSADHFRVGIDDLTVNLSNLSMLEYDKNGVNVLLRVRRLGVQGDPAPDPAYFLPTANLRDACQFTITRPYNSLAEIMERFTEIGRTIGNYINAGLANPQGGQLWNVPFNAQPLGVFDPNVHLRFDMTSGGLLRIMGNKLFWSNFAIDIPTEKYQMLLMGSTTYRYISLHPETSAQREAYDDAGLVRAFFPVLDGTTYAAPSEITELPRMVTGGMNLNHSLDRRVALEVGCSLPLKNSPMIDHGQEAPDFVLGRFNLGAENTASTDAYSGYAKLNLALGPRQLQGPRDRICYHHLGPQQKIQAMRMRLWARVRTYDSSKRKWGMQTIMCPVRDSDYWHIKLHFLHKSK